MARQPIVDRNQRLHAFELLFRGSRGPNGELDDQKATAAVLLAAITDLGWENLGCGMPLFVNVDERFLFSELVDVAPAELTTIELLEDIRPTPEVRAAAQSLAARGFRIALDDFVPGGPHESLLDVADIVKVDVLQVDRVELPLLVARLRARGILTVAEKVEDEAAYAACWEAGFDLFQGYYFARPEPRTGRAESPQRQTATRLLPLLLDPDADIANVVRLVQADAELSYRVLRIANSAAVGARSPISSIRQALVLVGPRELASWLSLMLLADDGGELSAPALDVLTMARTTELLITTHFRALAGQAFLCGLLRGLGDLRGEDLPKLLESISAAPDIRAAVLRHEGQLGVALAETCRYFAGESAPSVRARDAYLEALAWTSEIHKLSGSG